NDDLLANKTQIQFTGTGTGGVGDYSLSNAVTNVGSSSLYSEGISWYNQTVVLGQLNTLFPIPYYTGYELNSVGYTDGAGSATGTMAGKIADMTDMVAQYDALGEPGGPIQFFVDEAPIISNATTRTQNGMGTSTFMRTNAPGAGGPFSGRFFATTPFCQW